MGVRKEGSGKSRSTDNYRPGSTGGSSAVPALEAEKDSDEDSDPELQEVYVQAYACQIFRDDAAAAAVDDGVHLRPLAASQEPGAEPLMLDRFDARWMLDLPDFDKNKKGATSNLPAKLVAEERQADTLRYASLPSGDHSLVVEGLDQFAPSGSYAHGSKRGGLGDDDDEEPQPEVYGYYGRTASPPRSSVATGSGAWASTPAPQYSVDSRREGDESAASAAASGAAGGAGGDGGGGQARGEGASADGAEAFVADFAVPEGVVAPATIRQHMMMVGTARTAVRSPQLEVLLRLKQQSNLAFSFLSDEDPVHPYYVFLKSWGESALADEYARQQRLQAERKEARRREEASRKEREERAAAAAAAASKAAKEAASPPLPPADAGGSGESDADADAPNLLGGAYESSEDEGGPSTPAPRAAAPSTTGEGDRSEASPLEPGEEKRQVVEKMVGYVAKNGQAFEDRVRNREKSNPTFDFLVPTNQFHAYYKMRLALAKGDGRAPAAPAAPAATRHSNQPPSGGVSPQREAEQPSGWIDTEKLRSGAGPAGAAAASTPPPLPDSPAAEGSKGGADAAGVSAPATVGSSAGKLAAKLGPTLSRIDEREGKGKASSLPDPSPDEDDRSGSSAVNGGIAAEVGSSSSSAVAAGENGSKTGTAAAAEVAVSTHPTPASIEDPETRRANRLKRARLMTGHYKLAVMEHSSDQQENGGGASSGPVAGTRPSGGGAGGGGDDADGSDGLSSADGLSDLDDYSSGDGSESQGDAGGGAGFGVDDVKGEEANGEKHFTATAAAAATAGGRNRGSRDGGDGHGSTAAKRKPPSGGISRSRGQQGEDDEDGGRRYGSGSHRKQSSGSERRRGKDKDRGLADDSRGGDDRRASRKGRSRSRSRSTSRGRSSRRPGSGRDRESGGGSRADARDRKDGGRGERVDLQCEILWAENCVRVALYLREGDADADCGDRLGVDESDYRAASARTLHSLTALSGELVGLRGDLRLDVDRLSSRLLAKIREEAFVYAGECASRAPSSASRDVKAIFSVAVSQPHVEQLFAAQAILELRKTRSLSLGRWLWRGNNLSELWAAAKFGGGVAPVATENGLTGAPREPRGRTQGGGDGKKVWAPWEVEAANASPEPLKARAWIPGGASVAVVVPGLYVVSSGFFSQLPFVAKVYLDVDPICSFSSPEQATFLGRQREKLSPGSGLPEKEADETQGGSRWRCRYNHPAGEVLATSARSTWWSQREG
eukprot:g14821.t2